MRQFLERLLYFWAAITAVGLFLIILLWALWTILWVAFICLFISIPVTAFYHFYWSKKTS